MSQATPDESEAPWQPIARRKQAYRDSTIPSAWRVSPDLLPKDPPKLEYGPQNVLSVPRKCGVLSELEVSMTEEYTIKSLLAAIASKQLKAVDVTTAFCKRAAIAQQLTNCLTEPLFTSAVSRATELDAYLENNGKPWGPLHGLPITMKDTFNIQGVDTSIGLAALCFKPAQDNAPLVDLLLSLGCVIIAKTNVPQTLGALDSVNNVFGRTMNPLNRMLTPGGSSGGEGVVVAMKGCMIGWGTDLGGSIRAPAMCNGVYGFKPANGRIPFGGQALTAVEGMTRCGITPVAGPIGRSIEDIDLVLREVVPRTSLWAEDCMPSTWHERPAISRSGKHGEFVIGVLRDDGNCHPLPPITKVLNETIAQLRNVGVTVIELPTPPAWTKCERVIQKLNSLDAAKHFSDLLDATGEPLVPWLKTQFRRGTTRSLQHAADTQAQRTRLEQEMLNLWVESDDQGGRKSKVDAILCPVAPHPVPEIDRYSTAGFGFASSWTLLDYPAGSVPVRDFTEEDLELGKPFTEKSLGSLDDKNRELWDEQTVDRKVYLGASLSVQVVTPRLEDQRLLEAMRIVDHAIRGKPLQVKL